MVEKNKVGVLLTEVVSMFVVSCTFAGLVSSRELVVIGGELELVEEGASEPVMRGVSVPLKGVVSKLVREVASEFVVG